MALASFTPYARGYTLGASTRASAAITGCGDSGYDAALRHVIEQSGSIPAPRGKRLVVVVGQKKARATAVRNVSGKRRWPKLQEWLHPGPSHATDQRIGRAGYRTNGRWVKQQAPSARPAPLDECSPRHATLPRLGSRVRIPSPAPNKSLENQREHGVSADHVLASNGLNEPRTVPKNVDCLGKRRARRSRKIPEGPPEETPPQKRSPTLAASKRRANRIKKCSDRKSTAARAKAQEPEQHFYWIADGQINIGFVEQVAETYKAISADERELGTFDSLKAAADAISEQLERRGGADA